MSGGELFVATWGQGPDVVFLHGLGASSRYWEPLAEAGTGYRATAPDRRLRAKFDRLLDATRRAIVVVGQPAPQTLPGGTVTTTVPRPRLRPALSVAFAMAVLAAACGKSTDKPAVIQEDGKQASPAMAARSSFRQGIPVSRGSSSSAGTAVSPIALTTWPRRPSSSKRRAGPPGDGDSG